MGRRIISSLLLMALIFSLPVFSLADGEEVAVKDSGSPEVSLMALRSIAADEGISLAAAEGDSGQFGYNIEPYQGAIEVFGFNTRLTDYILLVTLPPGFYSYSISMSSSFDSIGVINESTGERIARGTVSGTSGTVNFVLDEPIYCQLYAYKSSSFLPSDFISYSLMELSPVEGISSGYTYSSGILERSTRSIFSSFDADFGSQPAGKYLVNIYHWGDSYDVRFQISDSTESYYLPTSTNGSVTTLVYNHPGGQFTLDGSFTASNDETSSVYGDLYAHVDGSFTGSFSADSPLSWVFNIKDIVAISYDQAADHNFGIFAPIIGFFNDHFSSMKTFIAEQIDKIAGDDETKSDVESASDELNQEVQDLQSLSSDLNTQSSNLEQQFTTDFAVPDQLTGNTSSIQAIYNFLFSSLGIFSIFIWLPVVLAVIKKLLRL